MTEFLFVLAAWFIAGHVFFGPRWIPDGLGGIVAVYVDLWERVKR